MKMVIAVIQPDKLADVKDALVAAKITKMTASNVIGCGQQMGYTETYRGIPAEINLLKKVELRIAVNEEFVKPTIDAIIKAGTVDQKAVIAALEGMKYQGLTGEEEVRKGDHQVLKNYYLLKGKAKAQMKNKDDYVEVLSAGKSFLPIDKTGCKRA